MPDTPPFNAPPQPAHGAFQVAEWSNARGYWLIRDMTEAELAVAFPPPVVPDLTLEEERATWVLTKIQFALATMGAAIITPQEAEDWVGSGTIPAIATTALDTLPDDGTRAAARVRFRGASTIARTDPFIALLQATLEMTDEQVDTLFQAGLAL